MKPVVMLGVFAALGLAVLTSFAEASEVSEAEGRRRLAAEGPARPASPVPDKAVALAEAPAERREVLRERRLSVVLVLKDTTSTQGAMESYEPGKDGLPGTFVLGLEGGKTKVVYEVDVVRVEVGEAVKEPRPVRREEMRKLLDAIRAGRVDRFIKDHRTVLKTAKTVPQAQDEYLLLFAAYRHQGLEKKAMRERLMADVDRVENESIRSELRKQLQGERFLWAKPPRSGAGRGPAPGN